jgi:hypothetical protein
MDTLSRFQNNDIVFMPMLDASMLEAGMGSKQSCRVQLMSFVVLRTACIHPSYMQCSIRKLCDSMVVYHW